MANTKNSGYDTTWFVDEDLIKEFICSICTNVAKIVTTTECDHIYCTTCITEWFATKKECPLCRKKNPSITRNTFTDKRILDLKVHPESRKRKQEEEEEEKIKTLKERLQLQKKWCISCCQENYPDEHETCPSRINSTEGKKLLQLASTNNPIFKIPTKSFVSSSNSLATECIPMDDLRSAVFRSREAGDKWCYMAVNIAGSGTADAALKCFFHANQRALNIDGLQCVQEAVFLRIFSPEKTIDVSHSAGEVSREKISNNIVKIIKMDLRTFANALMDLSATKFQVVVYYNFVIKPEL